MSKSLDSNEGPSGIDETLEDMDWKGVEAEDEGRELNAAMLADI